MKVAREASGRVRIEVPDESIVVWAIGCTHFGSPGFERELFEEHLALAEAMGARTIHLGDVCDLSTQAFLLRHDLTEEEQQDLDAQIREASLYFSEVVFDACVSGNHDERYNIGGHTRDTTGKLWTHRILPDLRAMGNRGALAYLHYTGLVTYVVGGRETSLVLNHGVGGGMVNPRTGLNRLRDANEGFDAYLLGQNHDLDIGYKGVRTPQGHRKLWYVRVPSYLGVGTAQYADRANYGAGGAPGSVLLTITGEGVVDVAPLV